MTFAARLPVDDLKVLRQMWRLRGLEEVARVSEAVIAHVSPARRVGVPDSRIPAAQVLANALVPSAERVAAEIRALVRG